MKYWSYWKTRNKILFMIIMSFLALFIILKIILPVIKWNMSYDISNIDTPQKAVEYYIEALEERNPKKAASVYPYQKEFMNIFSLSDTLYFDVDEIKEFPDETDEPDIVCYFVQGDYVSFDLMSCVDITSTRGFSVVFYVKQDTETGSWYIDSFGED